MKYKGNSTFSLYIVNALLGLWLWLFAIPALAATLPNKTLWLTNGEVTAVVNDGKNVYVGGNFTFVGPNTGHGAGINTGNGTTDSKAPFINGNVYASIPDGSGGWFVGGDFTSVGGVTRKNLAHITSTNVVDNSFNAELNAPVRSLALSKNNEVLYVGGDFTAANTDTRNYIAAVETAKGTTLAWNPIVDGSVLAMARASDGASLYIGGSFNNVDGQARSNIASLSTSATTPGSYVATWAPATAPTPVEALVIGAKTVASTTTVTIYAAGGAAAASKVIAIDTTGATLWTAATDAKIRALSLTLSSDKLYVGGDFTTLQSSVRKFVGALKTSDGSIDTWNTDANGIVRALAVSDQRVYIGGDFTTVKGEQRRYVAALQNDSTGTISSFIAHANNKVHVLALAANSSATLFVGGEFTSVGGQERKGLASFEMSTGKATSWNPEVVGGTVKGIAISVDKTSLYIAGSFTGINSLTRNRVAKFVPGTKEPSSWDPNVDPGVVGSTINTISLSADGLPIKALAVNPVNNQVVYAGTDNGIYKTTDGGANWSATSLSGVKIRALTVNPTTNAVVYAATDSGFYKSADSGSTWQSANQGLANTKLLSMAVHPTNGAIIYLGAALTTGVTAEIFRSSDSGATWTALVATPTPGGIPAPHEDVSALAIDAKASPEIVYAGVKTAVWRSVDAGQTWTGILELTGSAAKKIGVVSGGSATAPSTVYVGFGALVIKSTDDGATFEQTTAISNDSISDFVISPTQTKTLYVATAASGIFRTIDAGKTWAGVNSGITNLLTYSLALDPINPDVLYTGASSGFVFKTSNGGNAWAEAHEGIAKDILYIGGNFSLIDSQPRNNLAALNTTATVAGAYVNAWNPNANGEVHTVTLDDKQKLLYAGGAFTSVGLSLRNRLAAVNIPDASVTSWNPNANANVLALALNDDDSTLYAGGDFTSIGTSSRNHLAAINTTSGTATAWDPSSDGPIKSLLLLDENLIFAAGNFTTIGGSARSHLASLRLDKATGNATAWAPNPNVAFPSGQLFSRNNFAVYLGGAFTVLNNESLTHLAAFEFTTPVAKATPPGGSYRVAQTVSINCILASKAECTPGYEIYYALDGTQTPTTLYTGALTFSLNTILRAFVVDTEGIRSPIATEDYILDYLGPDTTASPTGGQYEYTRPVTLTCIESGTKPAGCAATFYTIDGSTPSFVEKFNAANKVFEYEATGTTKRYIPNDPVPIRTSSTLKFFSVDNAGNPGPISEASFEITRGAGSGWLDFPMLILALLGVVGGLLRSRLS